MEQKLNPFEEAKKKRKEQQEAEEREKAEKKNRSYTSNYEERQFMGLTQKSQALRLLGLPIEMREKPTDAYFFYWSKIVNDTGKGFVNIYWPYTLDHKLDEDWIFYRLWKKITDAEFVKYKEGETRDPSKKGNDNGYYVDKYAGTPSHTRLEKNKKDGSNQFGHVYPKQRVAFNVIDRMDNWCVENKHSKLLSSSHSPFSFTDDTGQKKTIYFTDPGVPFELYKLIFNQVVEFRNGWDLDLAVYKEEKKYILRDAMEDKIPEDIKKLMNFQPLTDEEKTYGLYKVEEMYKPTGYYKLYNSFEKLFKQADIDMGTKFHPELVELYETEKVELEKQRKESEAKGESQSPGVDVPKSEIPTSSPAPEEPSRRRAPQAEEESVESKLSKLPHWDKLSTLDKASMTNSCLNIEGDKFTFKEGTSLVSCDCERKIKFPDDVYNCTLCGKKFE